jgi:hypothetical protein
MTTKRIMTKINRSSLGTRSARAARSSISGQFAAKAVARTNAQRAMDKKSPKKAGG